MPKYLDFRKEIEDEKLKDSAETLKDGGIVVFPTETVYGLGACMWKETAVKKLYEVKQRSFNKPISLLVSNIDMIKEVAKDITELEYALMKAFFPGPFTIILKKKDIVPNIVTANLDTVGIRLPANEIALKLIRYAGFPIATTSSNISGRPSVTNLGDVMSEFEGKVDCFINGGPSEIGVASTIVQVIDGKVHILREGSISKEQIDKICLKYYKNEI